MLVTNVFLGNPPEKTRQWIINHYTEEKSEWDKLVEKLEAFDSTKTPLSQGLPEVGSGVTTKYMICDGYMNGGTFVPCLTKVSVMENIDLIDSVDTPWIVLGYDGTVPQYVKYKNGKDYLYVSSVDDTIAEYGFLRSIAAGCATYARSWDAVSMRNVFTATGKAVQSVGSSIFTYGQTNANCGTTATTAGGYSVPTVINVDGKAYDFCGHTMTVQSQYILGSSKDGATVTEKTCSFSYGTSSSTRRTRWSDSHMRVFLNSRCGHNEITYPRLTPTANMLAFTNGIGLKLAKDQDFLKHCPPTIRRNWVYSTYRDGGAQLDANYCEHTANDFILLGSANVNALDNNYTNGNLYEDFAKFTTVYPVETKVGDSTITTDTLKKFPMDTLAGAPAASAANWRLSSANTSNTHNVAYVHSNGYVDSSSSTTARGLAPACSIY